MWVQIAHVMSRLEEEPNVQAEPNHLAAQLQLQEQQLADILEEEIAQHDQVSILSQMHLQQAEEMKPQSQEIRRLSALVEQQQRTIE